MNEDFFPDWSARKINRVIMDINAELPFEQCSEELNDTEKAWYIKSLEKLKKGESRKPEYSNRV